MSAVCRICEGETDDWVARCKGLLVGCLASQQHASVSQGWICSDKFTCCHTEIEVADPTFHLTQSQYTDTGPTSPSTDPTTPGTWQGSYWSANFYITGMTWSWRKRDSSPESSALKADALTTRPTRRSMTQGKTVAFKGVQPELSKYKTKNKLCFCWNCL